MIRHIVLFRLNGTSIEAKREQAAGVAERLLPLKGSIDGLLEIDIQPDLGLVDSQHWDLALVADYQDNAALEAYQVHPLHQEALVWINPVVESRAIVDFAIDPA